jgi:hypothetical protein
LIIIYHMVTSTDHVNVRLKGMLSNLVRYNLGVLR